MKRKLKLLTGLSLLPLWVLSEGISQDYSEGRNVIWPEEMEEYQLQKKALDDLGEITSLVDIVMEDEQKVFADGVLSYLTGIYSNHGYNESGNWGTDLNIVTYVPYHGKLPEYDVNDFVLPVEGRLTSRFGYREIFKRMHRGIDLALHTGDTVSCVLPGVVTKTGFDHKGYGRYVVVTHSGDMETLYGHLQMCMVTPGQELKAGEPLGLGGNTGNATGPHLHFETRLKGVAVDPQLIWRIRE